MVNRASEAQNSTLFQWNCNLPESLKYYVIDSTNLWRGGHYEVQRIPRYNDNVAIVKTDFRNTPMS